MALDIRKIFPYVIAGWLPGGRRYCVLCAHHVRRFMPYRKGLRGVPPLMSALEVVGSDVENFECPRCGSHDRERHLFLYLRTMGFIEWMHNKSILHFAPEKRLSQKILAAGPAQYTQCDLAPQSSDVIKVDMLDIEFDSECFDVVIANHVLEHVGDVARARKEILRILKVGGYAILQAPYSPKLRKTWSDPGIDTAVARLQAYGQEDHVRLFGADIFNATISVGFESCVREHMDLLADFDSNVYGVNFREPLFLFKRVE